MKKILILATTILATISVLSCQKAENAEIVPVTGVTMNQTEVSLFPGEQVELKAVVSPDNSTSSYKTWSSSDAKIATVDVWGRVNALSPGTAIITAKTASGNLTASCKVIVKEIVATAISLNKSEATVYVDETDTLSVRFEPENSSYKDVKWSSADTTIAIVDSTGIVRGIDLGTTTIKATSRHGLVASCAVKVAVRVPTEPEVLEFWKSDKASYRGLFGAAADNGKSAGEDGWLHYQDGVVFWAENTSGKLREATLELSTGSKITITQFSANEFTGSWTLYSKLFDNNKRMGGSKNDCQTAVSINLAKGDNNNNITISGLYPETTVEGKVAIDYDTKKVKIGVYCSHKIYKSKFGHCVLLPECASAAAGSYWGGYEFCPKNDKQFSDTNYDWLWFDFNEELNTAKYQYHGAGQLAANEKYRYCGLSFVVASETAITGTAYDLIHQANYNGSNTESMYFKR